jgi:non-specific serine/threonine protein kinase
LNASRLVTLVGAPGVGKTRLSLEVGARFANRYADGVCFVELAPLIDPTLVSDTVAMALGVSDRSGRGAELVVTDYLRAKSLLLILDNCEHVIVRCAALVESLLRACPYLSVLATSREALAAEGETLWRVPSLTQPSSTDGESVEALRQAESVQLFVDRARAVQPRFAANAENVPAIARICRRLDGIALAIELATARVRVLSIQQIADRLDDRFRLLVGGGRSTLPRHRTLRALVDWSHDLLSESEVTLFRRLSVFAGGWTLEAAEQVCAGDGLAREDILDLLERLVDRSLVQVTEQDGAARYWLLETLREYGRERLDQAGETKAICRRHLAWVQALAKEARPKLHGPELPHCLEQLQAELDNIRAALGRGLSDPDLTAPVQRIIGRLTRFWYLRGHLSEGRRWSVDALQIRWGTRTLSRASALHALGNLARNQGDYPAAFAAFEECRSIAEDFGDKAWLAPALYGLGTVVRFQGDSDGAMRYVQRSLELWRELDDLWGITISLGTIGVLERRRGNRDCAEQLLIEAQVLSRQIGDNWCLAQTHAHLGVIAHERGELDRAAEQLQAGLALHAGLENHHDVAWVRNKLAYLALNQGDVAGAGTLYAQSLGVYRDEGALWGVTESLEGVASVMVRAERWDHAAQLYGAAQALRESAGLAESPTEQIDHNQDITSVRARLGEARFAAAQSVGGGMSLDEACELALAVTRPTRAPLAVVPLATRELLPSTWPLSARECQIAVQVARGLTNRRIAHELVIAKRTVDAHVYRILRKLGFESRAQIAAWTVERGLFKPASD